MTRALFIVGLLVGCAGQDTDVPDGDPDSDTVEQVDNATRVHFLEVEGAWQVVYGVTEPSASERMLLPWGEPELRGSYRLSAWLEGADGLAYEVGLATGSVYTQIVPELSFRVPTMQPFDYELWAEDGLGGSSVVATGVVRPGELPSLERLALARRTILPSDAARPYRVLVLSEGYRAGDGERFFDDAGAFADVLVAADFPAMEQLEIEAVYLASNGAFPVAEGREGEPAPDTTLRLDYPWWAGLDSVGFNRWFQVVYPTSERHFRAVAGQVAHDAVVALVDIDAFMGMGSYRVATVLPAGHRRFSYLALHEFGHQFGLGEEYSSGATELYFGEVDSYWVPNQAFGAQREHLPWSDMVDVDTPLPTSAEEFGTFGVGAYPGGYAGMDERSHTPVPKGECVMSSGDAYCAVCREAIEAELRGN